MMSHKNVMLIYDVTQECDVSNDIFFKNTSSSVKTKHLLEIGPRGVTQLNQLP